MSNKKLINFVVGMNNAEATTSAGPINIDLGRILGERKGTRCVPGFVVRWLSRLIHQDELNEMLRVAYPARGAAFCRAVLDHLGVRVSVRCEERLPAPSLRRVIYVSNHPLGGLDGMALIDWATRRHGVEPRFVVNDLLMAVEPLGDVFLPVNKHGGQSRRSIAAIDSALAEDRPLIIFPAGLCSRSRGGVVADLEWKKMFVQKARQTGRLILPLHFKGSNSRRFYRLARLRERLGIRLNIEMALLPGEVFRARGKEFEIVCGNPVDAAALPGDAQDVAADLRRYVIDL